MVGECDDSTHAPRLCCGHRFLHNVIHIKTGRRGPLCLSLFAALSEPRSTAHAPHAPSRVCFVDFLFSKCALCPHRISRCVYSTETVCFVLPAAVASARRSETGAVAQRSPVFVFKCKSLLHDIRSHCIVCCVVLRCVLLSLWMCFAISKCMAPMLMGFSRKPDEVIPHG